MEKIDYINTNNLVVDITEVVPNEYNPKLSIDDNEHNHYEFEKIKSSLQVAGQITPVIVRELTGEEATRGKYEIINGFHRHKAMAEMGLEKIEIKNLGAIDFDTAVSRALLTEDTKIPIDNIELAHLLKQVVTDEKPKEYWADLLPYTPDMIEQKIEMIDFDFNEYGGEPNDDEDDKADKVDFNFKVSNAEDRARCEMALSRMDDEDINHAFVALCNYYLNNGSND